MTDDMHNRRSRTTTFAGLLVDAAFIGGASLVTWGAALIYRPAGFIAAGLFLLSAAWLMARKGV
jgi:hypothetical protein